MRTVTDEKNTPETEPAAEPVVAPATDAAPDESREGEAAASGRDDDVTYASFAEAFEAVTDGPEGVDASAPPQYGVGRQCRDSSRLKDGRFSAPQRSRDALRMRADRCRRLSLHLS